jgi:hypothetical protein
MHFLISSTIAVYKFMNFYELNQIIEQSKVSEVVVNRPGFTATGQPVAKPVAPVTPTGTKPVAPGTKPAPVTPTVTKQARAKIKFGKTPPGCPSFGCREPEASPQDTAKNIQNLKPDQKEKVDKLVQNLTTAK